MKSIRLLTFSCLLLSAIQSAAAGEVIRITSGEYPPWTPEKLKHEGFTNHVIAEAFGLKGYEVEFTFYPWKRVYEAARDGKTYHATSFWYPSDERRKEFHYSDALQEDKTVFFHMKATRFPDWATLDDLKDKRIGATREYTYTQEFWDAQKGGRLNIETANSDELNFRKLFKGRIDASPTADLVGQSLVREKFSPEEAATVAFHPKALMSTTGHLLFSRQSEDSEELLTIFNRGLAKLKESGRHAELQADLIAGRYEPKSPIAHRDNAAKGSRPRVVNDSQLPLQAVALQYCLDASIFF